MHVSVHPTLSKTNCFLSDNYGNSPLNLKFALILVYLSGIKSVRRCPLSSPFIRQGQSSARCRMASAGRLMSALRHSACPGVTSNAEAASILNVFGIYYLSAIAFLFGRKEVRQE